MNAIVKAGLDTAKQELQPQTSSILSAAQSLAVVDAASYELADAYLLKVRNARKIVDSKMADILDPLNESRNAALKLRRELDNPLETAEGLIRTKMSQFKMAEMRQLEEQRRKKQEEEDRIARELQERDRRLREASSAAARALAAKRLAATETKAAEVSARPTLVPVAAASSRTRVVRSVIITDIPAFLRGVLNGQIPYEMVGVNTAELRRVPVDVAGNWPGCEIKEDIQIVGR